jgi:hypothetical protein
MFPRKRSLAPPDISEGNHHSARVTWYESISDDFGKNTIIRRIIVGLVIDCLLGHNRYGHSLSDPVELKLFGRFLMKDIWLQYWLNLVKVSLYLLPCEYWCLLRFVRLKWIRQVASWASLEFKLMQDSYNKILWPMCSTMLYMNKLMSLPCLIHMDDWECVTWGNRGKSEVAPSVTCSVVIQIHWESI